jgi:hypothetical protein
MARGEDVGTVITAKKVYTMVSGYTGDFSTRK